MRAQTDTTQATGGTGGNSGEAERVAQAMFQRVLSGWACDVLALRKAGLDRPRFRAEPAGEMIDTVLQHSGTGRRRRRKARK